MKSLIKNKNVNILLFSFIVLYPWLFHVFQGLYVPELGYWLVSYENFFSNPEVSQTTFSCWLTTFLGAVVNAFVGKMGVIGFKIANVFSIYLILYVLYKILFEFSTKTTLLFSLLIAEVMINSYDFINYYTLTTLFFIVSAFYIYKGLSQNKLIYLFFAGVFLALNIFIRFPNILGIGLLTTILYYNYGMGNLHYKETLKQILILVLGYIVTIAIVLLVMKMMGHYDLYIQKINDLFELSKGSSHHGSANIINKYFLAQWDAVKLSLYTFAGMLLILGANKFPVKNNLLNCMFSFILVAFLVYSLIKLSGIEYTNYSPMYYGIIGFLYISLLWISFRQLKKNTSLGLIALLAFLTMEIIPFGSATILHQSKFGIYFAIPVIFTYIFSIHKSSFIYSSFKKDAMKYLGIVLGLTLIMYSLLTTIVYHPPGLDMNRWKMTYSVNDPHLRAIFMSKEKAKTLNELSIAMNKYSSNLSHILTYGEISTVNYMSTLKPYLNNTYPFFMTNNKLKDELGYQQKRKTLPMVVRAKTYTPLKGWPVNSRKIDNSKGVKRVIFGHFLKKNNYQTVWQNRDFEILIPFSVIDDIEFDSVV